MDVENQSNPGFLGTGLTPPATAVILASSVFVFLFWGGPLWSATAGTSHVLRIGLSYAIVIPLAAATLARARALTLGRLATATALIWAVKLIVTSTLYFGIAPSSAQVYEAEPIKAPSAVEPRAEKYHPAEAKVPEYGRITGTVSRAGAPLAGAVVWIDAPPPGRALTAGAPVEIEIRDGNYAKPIYAANRVTELEAANRDRELHTLTLTRAGRTRANVPLPPGEDKHRIVVPSGPGLYTLGCQTHKNERGVLLLSDHPYFAFTAADGSFALEDVPPGEFSLRAADASGAEMAVQITVAAREHATKSIDIAEVSGR